jgi:predicted NAD/FAD-dependent oxidoreductase
MFEVRPKPGLVGIVGAGGAGLAAAQAMQTRGVPYVMWGLLRCGVGRKSGRLNR